ncbi:hypothetical protein OA094_01285 [Candidatus Pelagibacter sp.]|nr:hypothetical protein [Candidatus Pelagibacter sp.]
MNLIIRITKLWAQILRQIIFVFKKKIFKIIYIFLKDKDDLKNLIDNGYLHFKNKIPLDFLEYLEKKYHKFEEKDVNVVQTCDLDEKDLNKIFEYLENKNVMSLIKSYLGKSLYTYQNQYHYLDSKKSNTSSWQPHHDSKYNRLKVYIWISKNSKDSHPIYYLRGDQMRIKTWLDYKETRYPDNSKKLDEIWGKPGDIIIFDTHGVHSNFKYKIEPRKVIVLTFDPIGIFSRINPLSKKGREIMRFHGGQKI